MCPVFSLGGVELHAYALFTAAGAVAACLLALPALKRAGMTAGQSAAALLLMCVSFLLGARLWNVAVNPVNYMGKFKWYTLKLAGLSLYGGLIGAVAALILFAKVCRIRIFPILDAMVVPGSVAFCFARIGCFLNGCCGGKATNSSFGVIFPDHNTGEQSFSGMLSFLNNRPVHPTQLYELAGAAIGLLLVLLICRKIHAEPGSKFMLYAAVFSAVRLFVLPFRVLTYPDVIKNILYPALYLAIIVIGVAWTIRRHSFANAARR